MKQTNSAIKFLIAQYRAIFRNANITMALALATAAGAVVSAPAAAAAKTSIATWADLVTNADKGVLAIDGTEKDIVIPKGDSGSFNDTLIINITGGDNSIQGAGATPDTTPAAVFSGKNVTINLNSSGDSGAATLGIGNTTGNTEVNVKAVNVSKGTLTIAAQSQGKPSTLKAEDIVLGVAGSEKNDLNQVNIAAQGTLAATNSLTVEAGSNATVEGKVLGKTITINGGALTLSGSATAADTTLGGFAAKEGDIGTDTLSINGGKVTAAATKSGSILADTINLSGGEIDAAGALVIGKAGKAFNVTKGTVKTSATASALTINSNADFNGGKLQVASGSATLNGTANFGKDSFVNSGTVVLNGETTFANDALGTSAIGADGVVKIGNAKVTMNAATFAALTKGAKNKIHVSGDGNPVAHINLTDDSVDLSTAGILADAGTLGDKLAVDAGKFKFSAKAATYEKNTIKAGEFELTSLTAGTTDGLIISGGAAIGVTDGLSVKDNKALKVQEGSVTLAGSTAETAKKVAAESVTLGDTSKAGTLNVTSGNWEVTGLKVTSGAANVSGNAELILKGDLTTTGKNGKLTGADNAVINAKGVGKLTLGATDGAGMTLSNASKVIFDAADLVDASGNLVSTVSQNSITGSSNSVMRVESGDALLSLTKTQYEKFRTETGFKGMFEVKVTELKAKDEMTFTGTGEDKVLAGVNKGYENTQVSLKSTEAVGDVYSVGNLKVTEGEVATIGENGSLNLQNSTANKSNNFFVSRVSGSGTDAKTVAAGIKFDATATADSGLTLEKSGTIGAITTANAGVGYVTFGAQNSTGDVKVEGGLGASGTELAKVVTNGSNVDVQSGDVYAHNLQVNGGSLSVAEDKSVVVGNAKAALASEIKGDVEAGKLTLLGTSGSLNIKGGADVSVGTLTGAAGVAINVGDASVDNGSASLFAETLLLNNSTLLIDPKYTEKFASVTVSEFKKDTNAQADDKSAGVVGGKIIVGQNAALGVGFNSDAELRDLLSEYVDPADGSFYEQAKDGLTNALVLNKKLTLGAGDSILVDKTVTTDTPAQPNAKALTLAAGTGLIITENVFTVDKATGQKTGAAITMESNTDNISATDASLILIGDFSAKDSDLTIFDKTSSDLTGLKVESANGLLKGTFDATNKGHLALAINPDVADKIFLDASAPVRDLMLAKAKGELDGGPGLGWDFIGKYTTSSTSGAVVDAAAHAATYAGAQQAAVAAVTTMADAMFGRVGAVGVEAASISATGSKANGGVWLTPMYKSVDADGFNAEGASYGSDVDLAGVAFGTDTVRGNMRFGAVFNIGSGDADGKGNGAGLKDEFDYYGFGIYSAMGFGNLALVGDASLTVISHEVKGLEHKGEADTTAVTMGLTGQYTIATPMVDVTPHVGARFIRLDTDSYDLVGAKGTLATTDFDVQNVFSVPLGVTLSKAFVAGGWSLAPSADLTIAFNTGDTEAKSTTTFSGVKPINLNTEVLDEVTYGISLGLGAQYGAFGTSFGLNYTGSENTDSFGVNAQARYMF